MSALSRQGLLLLIFTAVAASAIAPATEECDEIVKQATPRLAPVGVVSVEKSDQEQGTRTETSKIRTSWGMFFARGENDLIKGEWVQLEHQKVIEQPYMACC
jgi:hypothetical protein